MHMAGNAAEWVYDFYDPHYYGRSPVLNPQGPDTGKVHVFRGGSYLSDPAQLAVYWRGFSLGNQPNQKKEAGYAYSRPAIGIRCAKSIALVEPPRTKTRRVKQFQTLNRRNEYREENDFSSKAGPTYDPCCATLNSNCRLWNLARRWPLRWG